MLLQWSKTNESRAHKCENANLIIDEWEQTMQWGWMTWGWLCPQRERQQLRCVRERWTIEGDCLKSVRAFMIENNE